MTRRDTRPLVIVESPGKVKKVKTILGDGYLIRATAGHVRDLPEHTLGVALEDSFAEQYEILPDKTDIVARLVKAAHDARMSYLATDPDREGEAIAWHLEALLSANTHTRRITFNQITAAALHEALQTPRRIDQALVDAQRGKRIIDRLISYMVGPLLAQLYALQLGLPASDGSIVVPGQIQTATLRLVVERERERRNFTVRNYWTIHAELASARQPDLPFVANLTRPATLSNPVEKDDILAELRDAPVWWVERVETHEEDIFPPPPFTTSTLYQDATRALDLQPEQTAAAAQSLYEAGLVTYFRTESTRIAPEARASARSTIASFYGSEYLPSLPSGTGPLGPTGAQPLQPQGGGAHEAIRPTDPTLHPVYMRQRPRGLSESAVALYDLIWRRFIASQMMPGRVSIVENHIRVGQRSNPLPYPFLARSRAIIFDGFQMLYHETAETDDLPDPEVSEDMVLPPLVSSELVRLVQLVPAEWHSQPPRRFSPARLVARMEQVGIARPSTYADILHKLAQHGHVSWNGRHLVPTALGEAMLDLLVEHFSDVFDIQFTAAIEKLLDQIARGQTSHVDILGAFYEETLYPALERTRRRLLTEYNIPPHCPSCGQPTSVRSGKSGPFAGCMAYPDCRWKLDLSRPASDSHETVPL